MTECESERVAIISEGCKVSMETAQQMHERSQQLEPDHYAQKVARLRQTLRETKMRRHQGIDMKKLAGGDK